tara:strand:+ start:5317 stop:6381 length:1065 start_codon:yes stop_codon:yes gene_type:complete
VHYIKFCFLWASLLSVVSCVEYSITQPNVIKGEANPPDVKIQVEKDTITQIAKFKTDILWVIDNSCSMSEEQTALTNNFDSFINYFIGSGLDWHVGVVSTDMLHPDQQGRLRSSLGYNFIDENTPQPTLIFRQMAAMGVSGSGVEKGLATSYNAIEVHGEDANKDFYREDALLSIIVISDEPDFSTEITIEEYISWLQNLKDDPEDVIFSSIVCLQEGYLNGIRCDNPPAWTAPLVGKQYIEVTNVIGGALWDIRENNWDEVLDELGFLTSGLKKEFFLSDIPVLETLDVYVQEPEGNTYEFKLDLDYTYSRVRNSITFISYTPPQYSKVNIEYIPLESFYGDISFEDTDTSLE